MPDVRKVKVELDPFSWRKAAIIAATLGLTLQKWYGIILKDAIEAMWVHLGEQPGVEVPAEDGSPQLQEADHGQAERRES